MLALVCPDKEQPFVVQEVPLPQVEKNEVLVQVKAAAINHRDYWIQKGQYANLRYPAILGSDGSGIVAAVGEAVNEHWLGKEVIINPAMNWGNNPAFNGPDFTILGLPRQGCFAEYVSVPVTQVHAKPTHLSFEQAAAIPLSGLTGYRALFTRAQLKPGDTLLLTGIGGGTALLMLQMAVAIGVQVYVTSGNDAKIDKAVQLGAAGGVNYTMNGWHKLLQAMVNGFDVIADSAAGDGFKNFVDLAKPGGRIVFFGGTQGPITTLNPQKIFWKQLNILGSTMGTPEEFSAMVALFQQYRIQPVIDEILSFENAEHAIRKMDDATQFGKLVLTLNK
ncbi:zinc-binding dehydrogenase [Deminuibacter soli]|uniref:Alcohol dehydrogenase n=1 Tax=Deminuibacter soli TaxID=2291815 RepID=A0A3E1NDD3_9BACT|nr:zinc-binding dehydrogenase [Deminuibacter soli]RFM25877.1 alcohol dehydrogenase [Deminuibacter soli]